MSLEQDIANVKWILERRGVKVSSGVQKHADASRMDVVGIDTLGKLDFLNANGYTVYLPTVEMRPEKGYRGLRHP